MVHLGVALHTFNWNTPHPHRCPQKHPLPEVGHGVRLYICGLWWIRWMEPVLRKLLPQLSCGFIKTLGNPLLIGWVDDPHELFGEKTHPIHHRRPQVDNVRRCGRKRRWWCRRMLLWGWRRLLLWWRGR